MNKDVTLEETIAVLEQFKPKSIFLYGSRGRGDANEDSDYEIGIIFDDDKYVRRAEIHAAITNPNVKAYGFGWGELSQGKLDFLFQKSIYLREIITGGKTIAGEDLLSQIPLVPITTLDLLQRVRFDIGMALAALLSYRSGDMQTSMEEFSKSCLFGLRCLEILELKSFPSGYEQIHKMSGNIVEDEEYVKVIEAAYEVREKGTVPSIDMVYNNISLLDSFIEPKLMESFNKQGNQDIV